MELFPQFFRAGGTMALAGTHFHFLKEIPILAKYEVRVSIGAWDEKWVRQLLIVSPLPATNFKLTI